MYYPRSLLKFVLLGFVLVCLPLVIALLQQNAALNFLAEQSSHSVLESSNISQLSQQLYEQAATLERLALQYTIVEDAAQLKDYETARSEFSTIYDRLRSRFSGNEPQTLASIREDEFRLWGSLRAFANARNLPRNEKSKLKDNIVDGYREFVDSTHRLQGEAEHLARLSVEKLQQTADVARSKWGVLLRVSLMIALLLAVLMSLMIARPLKTLDQAIRRMGSADFSQEIDVKGPKDLQHVGQRLEWLRVRLSTLEDQQNRFLRNVSHDLKTPLTAIREGAELLRDGVGGVLRSEQFEIVQIMHENTLSLQKMIENLLNYHQARVLEPETLLPVDIEKVVREVVEEHRLVAWRRLISFDLLLMPIMISGDKKKVATIIDNLVSNAIKYSPRLGKIIVLLRTQKGFARLDVLDEGSGVPTDEREKIFDTFFQGHAPKPADGHRVKGSGLGLAVAREYALAHGGRIKAGDRSDGRQGARLTLWLPIWKKNDASATNKLAPRKNRLPMPAEEK